jgi:hypothetical protein
MNICSNQIELEFENAGKLENPEINAWSKGSNNSIHNDTESGNRTQTRFVRRELSNYYTTHVSHMLVLIPKLIFTFGYRLLDCGNHTCNKVCHKGNCAPCKLKPSLITVCPCGKTTLQQFLGQDRQRQSCLDLIPTCEKICGKILPCSPEEGKWTECGIN